MKKIILLFIIVTGSIFSEENKILTFISELYYEIPIFIDNEINQINIIFNNKPTINYLISRDKKYNLIRNIDILKSGTKISEISFFYDSDNKLLQSKKIDLTNKQTYILNYIYKNDLLINIDSEENIESTKKYDFSCRITYNVNNQIESLSLTTLYGVAMGGYSSTFVYELDNSKPFIFIMDDHTPGRYQTFYQLTDEIIKVYSIPFESAPNMFNGPAVFKNDYEGKSIKYQLELLK